MYHLNIFSDFQMRNKLNEQQSSKLSAKQQMLSQRKDEVVMMDKRIAELQARLQKKRELQKEHQNNLVNQAKPQNSHPHMRPNVAAVEPYIQHVPQDVTKDDMYSTKDLKSGFMHSKNDPKYQTLPYNTKLGQQMFEKQF